MKLLILTQIVDREDPFLGFVHTWLEAFATKFEKITVICLKEGKHDLPENIEVYSLGKEEGGSRLKYVRRFLCYIWKFRKEYEGVFVHMNHEYVVLGGWLWRLMGKRVTLWRNHFEKKLLVDIAAPFCHTIFCTSKYSYTAKFKKTVLMPVGVPEQVFPLGDMEDREPSSILSFGRISPAKKTEQLIEALSVLRDRSVAFTATICGDALPELRDYETMLHDKVKELGLEEQVTFIPGISFEKVPELYKKYMISVNQTESGSYDKTIFEAMLSGTLSLSCNENLKGEIDDIFLFTEDSVKELADHLEQLLLLPDYEKKQKGEELRSYALENHSLSSLVEKVFKEMHGK